MNTVSYYTGGLAELISSPSPITYSYISTWFTGVGSIGRAMEILKLPYEHTTLPILEMVNGELVVNLDHEQRALYKKTIFSYAPQKSIHDTPNLQIDFKKLLSPTCIGNTLKIVMAQAQWISHIDKTIEMAQKLVDEVPATSNEHPEDILRDHVWPSVIAIGLIAEFYNQLIASEEKNNVQQINAYISNRMARDDWFFKSIADQEKVKHNKMSFEKYITEYGLRADKDYELTSPRWYEMPDTIKERIEQSTPHLQKDMQNPVTDARKQNIIEAAIKLQLLRSEVKRKALVHIDQLRKHILTENPERRNRQHTSSKKIEKSTASFPKTGKGTPVCMGTMRGTAHHINDNYIEIKPGIIGIFPNASPEFAIQYPKCAGMIFLVGGQTSHGAIVAREYGIPTIIDDSASDLPDEIELELDGEKGTWKVI